MHGYLAMTRTEFRLFRREPFSVIFVLAFPLMMMMLLAAVFGNKQADAHKIQNGMLIWRGVTPATYYTAASVAVIVAALGLMTLPITLTSYRQRGILRRFRASSVSASTLVSSFFMTEPLLDHNELSGYPMVTRVTTQFPIRNQSARTGA